MKSKQIQSVGLVFFILSVFIPGWIVQAGGVSPYDLIDSVNSYRLSQGLYALDPQSQVMAAAQAHADWIVETGQGGHTGEGGSDETIRVLWTGYGDGGSIHCDEAWASGPSVEFAVYTAWADYIHQAVMLDYWGNGYTDVGAGVASKGNGQYVFVLDVCMISGKPSPNKPTAVIVPGQEDTSSIISTEEVSQYINKVKISEAAADGSITHIVDYGQSLVQIALAYGVKVAEIRQLNGIPEDSTLIYPEQKLIIRKAGVVVSTGTPPEGTATAVDEPTATVTPVPTFTPRVKILPTLVITDQPVETEEPDLKTRPISSSVQTIGLILVVICGLGILVYMGLGLRKS